MNNKKIYYMMLSSILCAIGILIPMVSPIKVIIEPASFTLASHVAIMIAMFITPPVAICVALGTTLGFFFGGFPIVVVMRALSQVIFVAIGSFYLSKKPNTLKSLPKMIIFALIIGCIHAIGEVIVVIPFYFANGVSDAAISGFMYSVFTLVGIGTLIHSCVDFAISIAIFKLLLNNNQIKKVSNIKSIL